MRWRLPPAMGKWCLSADLGQANDSTALSVIEYVESPIEPIAGTDWIDAMCCRRKTPSASLQRSLSGAAQIGMSYVDQVNYVAALLAKEPLFSAKAMLSQSISRR